MTSLADDPTATPEALRAEVARLEAAVADLEDLASVITHDLQEPLRSVAGFGELIERRMAEGDEAAAHEYLGFVTDAAQRALERLAALSQWTRLGGRPLDRRSVELSSVLADVADLLSDDLDEAGAELVVAADLPSVVGDRALLAMALRHVLENAVRFRADDRPLKIEVAGGPSSDGFVEITISDNGIGVDEEHHERVWQLFERLHSRSRYPGNGVGLAVVRRIVERHHGHTRLSRRPQEGTAVHLHLPAGESTATPEGRS